MNNPVTINNLRGISSITPNDTKKSRTLTAVAGDLLSGVIADKTSKGTKVKLADGTGSAQYNFPPNSVQGEIGDEVFFEVQKSGGETMLKQIFPHESDFSKELRKQVSIKELKELMQKNDFIGDGDYSIKALRELEKEEYEKTQAAVSKIKRNLTYAVNNTNRAAIAAITASGINLSKISLDTLTEVVSQIEEALKSSDLPLTDANTGALKSAENKINEITEISDGDIVRILKDEKPVTVENVYIAKYRSAKQPAQMVDEEWNSILPGVIAMFNREGIDVDPATLSLARLLIANDVPLTKPNLETAMLLKNFKDNVDKDALMRQASEKLKSGGNPSDIPLAPIEEPAAGGETAEQNEYYRALIKDLPKFSLRHINHLLKDNLTLTLKNLQTAYNAMPRNERDNEPEADANTELKAISAQRQLAEIQLRMTRDAALRLSSKNIKIETLQLSEAVEALKALERETHAEALRMMGAADSAENVEEMADTFDKVKAFSEMTYRTFADITLSRIAFSISGVHSSLSAQQVNGKYEESATVPNPKYGDSFRKVMEQIAPLLDRLNIESTEQNVKAAGILSRNSIDITPENMLQIKEIDSKIETVYNRLHPVIAAKMIKEGLTPKNMHIDDVIAYIDGFNGTYGTNEGDNLSKHIYEMDKNLNNWQENREAMMDVYRMLNQIMRDGGVSLGLSLKTGKEPTLANLVNDSKIFRSGRANDYSVSNDAGFYQNSLVSNVISAANPEALSKLLRERGIDISLEQALNYLNESNAQNPVDEPNAVQLEQYLQQLAELQKTPAHVLKLMGDANIPVTLSSAQAMRGFLADSGYLGKTLDELDDEETGLTGTELEALKEGATPEELAAELEQRLLSQPPAQKINDAINALRLQNALSAATFSMHIPVKFNTKTADVHMYVVSDDIDLSGEVSVFMSLNTSFGTVQALMSLNNGTANLTIHCEKQAAGLFKENIDMLEELVNQAGFELGTVEFSEEIQYRGQIYG